MIINTAQKEYRTIETVNGVEIKQTNENAHYHIAVRYDNHKPITYHFFRTVEEAAKFIQMHNNAQPSIAAERI